MYQRSAYETFKRATAREIFAYDLTYRITAQPRCGNLLPLLLFKGTHHRSRICHNALCAACALPFLPFHHYRIQRLIGGTVGNGEIIFENIFIKAMKNPQRKAIEERLQRKKQKKDKKQIFFCKKVLTNSFSCAIMFKYAAG